MVGSRDYFREDIAGEVNVTTSERSPGSTIKMFTYLTAFLQGWTPATIVRDEPIDIKSRERAAPSRTGTSSSWGRSPCAPPSLSP